MAQNLEEKHSFIITFPVIKLNRHCGTARAQTKRSETNQFDSYHCSLTFKLNCFWWCLLSRKTQKKKNTIPLRVRITVSLGGGGGGAAGWSWIISLVIPFRCFIAVQVGNRVIAMNASISIAWCRVLYCYYLKQVSEVFSSYQKPFFKELNKRTIKSNHPNPINTKSHFNSPFCYISFLFQSSCDFKW